MGTTGRQGGRPWGVAVLLAAPAAVMAYAQEPIEAVATRPPEDWTYGLLFAGVLGLGGLACGVGLRVQVVNVLLGGLAVGAGVGWLSWTMVPARTLTVGAPFAAFMAIVGFVAGGRRAVRKFLRGNARPHGWIMDAPSRQRDPESWAPDNHDDGP